MSPETKRKAVHVVTEYAKALLQAGIIAAIIIIFFAQSHLVKGISMENTLHDRERLMIDKISYRFTEPKRGEIIVFRFAGDPRERFIKRVIGVPGDTIEIRNRVVYVNDTALDEPYIKEPTYYNVSAIQVQPGHVFVMGDNRNHSLDSRAFEVGQVPYRDIVGRAIFSYWPPPALKLMRAPHTLQSL